MKQPGRLAATTDAVVVDGGDESTARVTLIGIFVTDV
jgi:hypothetical protein